MSGSDSGDPPGDSGDDRERSAASPGRDSPDDNAESSQQRGDREHASGDGVTIEDDGIVRWFLETDDENVVLVRDVASSVALVAVVGLLLFAVSGLWPPLVAVESPSMEPNMHRGDLIFIVEDGRFTGDGAVGDTGIVTMQRGEETGYSEFGNPGDVIVFRPNGVTETTPIIHRAHFWVEKNERWVETKASEEFVNGATCEEIASCPAPYAGFITKGDNNPGYDQLPGSGARTTVVKPEWVTGKAMYRIPWLGHVRLTVDSFLGGMVVPGSPAGSAAPATTASAAGSGASGTGLGGAVAGATGIAGLAGGAVLAAGRYRS
ncbi:S26 family signal peptidase [Natrinema thermotolerans]|uniref:S26 family signal peptidase n=1 Tax=Natrinema thermotolerans TaxID=121872 RepID=A0AAF0PDF3_9EURY|nr:S26 family signal peptidase [Natrinema thermotolerans]ELZ15845.1 Signal peptidase I-like protein [Natrinema thermotolerans DSM 11552]QCC58840.1 S26 family signal peptidase [Natrinema thermotolerans]WMT09998.1 S26 family signal peptidase [Natrinema thermotolerans]